MVSLLRGYTLFLINYRRYLTSMSGHRGIWVNASQIKVKNRRPPRDNDRVDDGYEKNRYVSLYFQFEQLTCTNGRRAEFMQYSGFPSKVVRWDQKASRQDLYSPTSTCTFLCNDALCFENRYRKEKSDVYNTFYSSHSHWK